MKNPVSTGFDPRTAIAPPTYPARATPGRFCTDLSGSPIVPGTLRASSAASVFSNWSSFLRFPDTVVSKPVSARRR